MSSSARRAAGMARQRGHAGVVELELRRGGGRALGAVDHDRVAAGLGGDLDVLLDAAGGELEDDRHAVVGRLAQLLDLDREVVAAEEVGVARGRALVDADGQRAHLRDLLADLHAEQHPAGAGLGALADDDLDRIGHAQVLEIEPVARRRHLVDQAVGGLALLGQHAALARAGREARAREAHAERALGVRAERAEAHRRQVDREGELERLGDEVGAAAADPRLRLAVLAVALERQARHHARQEDEVVERRQLLERREAADLVAAELGLRVDGADRLGRPDVRAALVVAGGGVRNLVHQIFSQASGLRLLKYQSFCPETTLRNVNVPSTPFSRSRPCTRS